MTIEIFGGWLVGILDVFGFFLIAYLFTKNVAYSFFILAGFLLTQFSYPRAYPYVLIEWALELFGLITMFYFLHKSSTAAFRIRGAS